MELHEVWRQSPCILGTYRQARKVWRQLYGDPGPKMVLHMCNRGLCREPRHLYLGTALDNARDRQAVATYVPEVHLSYVTTLNTIPEGRRVSKGQPHSVATAAGIAATRSAKGLIVHPRCAACGKALRPGLHYYQASGAKYHSRCPHPDGAKPSVYRPPVLQEVVVQS